MNLKLPVLALVALTLGTSALPVKAGTTTFTGTYPSSCNISDQPSTVSMSIEGKTLKGITAKFSLVSNGPTQIDLSQVAVSSSPDSSASWTAKLRETLFDGSGLAIRSTSTNANAATTYNRNVPIPDSKVWEILMEVGRSDNTDLNVGTYTGSVTLTCTAP